MSEGFEHVREVIKDFPPTEPRPPASSSTDHRMQKNLHAVLGKLLDGMMSETDAAKYHRQLAVEDPENASTYRDMASYYEKRARQKESARLKAEKLDTAIQKFQAMGKDAETALEEWVSP